MSIAVDSAVRACSRWPVRIQRAETPVAVRLERAHAQLLGQGEGLAVVAGGRLALSGRLARRALAEEPQRPGLVAALLVLAGELDSLRGTLARVFQAASQQIRLAEADDRRRQLPAVCSWRPLAPPPVPPEPDPRQHAPPGHTPGPGRRPDGQKSRMCQSWHSPTARSSTGMARCTSPWRRYKTLTPGTPQSG